MFIGFHKDACKLRPAAEFEPGRTCQHPPLAQRRHKTELHLAATFTQAERLKCAACMADC